MRDVTERLQAILDAIEHVERYAARGRESFEGLWQKILRTKMCVVCSQRVWRAGGSRVLEKWEDIA